MIKNLVISGGGSKIITFLGAIKYIEENNLFNNIKNFYATSAGSMLSLLLCLKYSALEMETFSINFDLNKIFVIDTDNFFNDYNICDNIKLERFIKLLITYKLGTENENISLKQFYDITNKMLTVTSVSLKYKKAIYISYLNYPNLEVWKAVLMSCSIPFIFPPVKLDDDLFIDGAIMDNFPVCCIPIDQINNTLCIRSTGNDISKNIFKSDNIYDYVMHILKIIMLPKQKYENYNVINIEINKNIISNFLDIDISKENKKILIDHGYSVTKTYFDNNKINFYCKTNSSNSNINVKINKTRSNSI
jgi:predicted patatin/cPLA2 family phospholipase